MTQTSSFELLKEENDSTRCLPPQAAVSSTPLPEEVVGDLNNALPTMQHERKHWSNTLKVQ